jgi:hypothetical protein
MSENSIPQILCMVWFKSENWETLLNMFTDRHVMPATYEKWLQKAEAGFRHNESIGRTVIKVDIDPERFSVWCADRELDIDAKARAKFAGEIGYRMYCDQSGKGE